MQCVSCEALEYCRSPCFALHYCRHHCTAFNATGKSLRQVTCHATVSANAVWSSLALVLSHLQTLRAIFCAALGMLDDDLPDLQFSPSDGSGKEQCSTKQDGIPTASFDSQRKACRTAPGLRKGFLSGASALPNKKVRPLPRGVPNSCCCHAADRAVSAQANLTTSQ